MKIEEYKFKVRCSSANHIMGKWVNMPKPLTEKQQEKFDELTKKKSKSKELQKLFDKDMDYMHFTPTIDNLPDAAKKYAERHYKTWIYQKSQIYFDGKYPTKGIVKEDENIKYLHPNYENNKEQFENEWVTGEPDIIIHDKKEIRDLKSSWDYDSFPLFKTELDNKLYIDQGLGYMDLLGYRKYFVDYVLSDTPESLIEKEYWKKHGKSPNVKITPDTFSTLKSGDIFKIDKTISYNQFRKDYIYEDTPRELRIKTFEVKWDAERVEEMHKRVELLREYLKTLKY